MRSTEDHNYLEQAFYQTPFAFSYSSLNKLLDAPSVFYKEYVLKECEDDDPLHLRQSSLTHCLLLEPERQEEKFIFSPDDLPGGKTADALHKIYEEYLTLDDKEKEFTTLEHLSDSILEVMKEINLYQNLTDDKKEVKGVKLTGDEKRVKKMLDDKNISYFNFLKTKGSRKLIDPDMYDISARCVENIKKDVSILRLLGYTQEQHENANIGIYNEIELTAPLEGFPFGIKGILDNLVIDLNTKTIYINDFKTTNKRLIDFPESVETWRYWIQVSIYYRLVKEFVKEGKIELDDTWTVKIHFIVADKFNQVFAYPVSKKSFEEWNAKTEEVLKEAAFHYSERSYTLPFKFVTGNVEL